MHSVTVGEGGGGGRVSVDVILPMDEQEQGPRAQTQGSIEEPSPWLGAGVWDAIEAEDPWVDLVIRARQSLFVPMQHKDVVVAEARLKGESVEAAKHAWESAREVRAHSIVQQLASDLQDAGCAVHETDSRRGELVVTASAAVLQDLVADVRLATIEREESTVPSDDSAGYWLNVYGIELDGVEMESLTQSRHFYDRGFEGQGIQLGMAEGGDQAGADLVRRSHPGFASASGVSRHENRSYLGPFYGYVDPDPLHGRQHATATASVIIGDLTDGQDPGISSPWEQRRRSGVARKATLMGLSTSSRSRLVSQFTDPGREIRAVNFSFSTDTDPTCLGVDSWSDTVNELYESGILVVKSAGNDRHDDSSDCTVGSPGAAIGSFTVAAYDVVESGAGTVIRESSSRGGTTSEGRGRTVTAMTSNTSFQFPYTGRSDCPYDYGASFMAGGCTATPVAYGNTSGAAPVVTGAWGVFDSWYQSVFGDPGVGTRHALLLLQGDRRSESLFLDVGYDGLWGAGRLRMRSFDGAGLDGPARWTSATHCVADGQTRVIPVTSSPVSSDVDVIKVVAFTYDSRHGDNPFLPSDQVTLKLGHLQADGSYEVVAEDASSDNKKRLFVRDPAPGHYAVIIEGADVTSDLEGCGTDSQRVFWSYLHEDSDRETWEDLGVVRPEDQEIP